MNEFAASPWLTRLSDRWGHFAPALLSVAIVGVILAGLHPLSGPLMLSVPLLLFGFVIVSWLLMRQHDRRLCEHCAAALPLNPAEQATRYRARFWLAHTGSEPRFLLPYFAVLIGTNFLTSPSGRLIWALVQATMIYLIASYTTHRRLQPWCPWCSEGGGGSHREDDVTPPPPPGDRHQLV